MSRDLCRVLRWEVEANDLCRDRNGFVLIRDLLRLTMALWWLWKTQAIALEKMSHDLCRGVRWEID